MVKVKGYFYIQILYRETARFLYTGVASTRFGNSVNALESYRECIDRYSVVFGVESQVFHNNIG